MLAFSNDYYGMIFRATQSVELFCAYERIADKVLKILTDKQLYGEIQKNANTYAQAYTFRNVKRELTKVYGFKDE